jgi:hypothetical protein
VDSSGNDTLHIFARELTYAFGAERVAIARDSVIILRGDLKAESDSAAYLIDQQRVFLESRPKAHQKNNELTGLQIELDLTGMKLRQIWVRQEALAISIEDSLTNKVNRLTGKEIIATIADNRIRQIVAYDNARSQYFLKDKGVIQGVNSASADTIRVYFVEGEVDLIEVQGGSEGVYKPDSAPQTQPNANAGAAAQPEPDDRRNIR